ncbi:methyltransferase domain-containing protein [Christensenellaceae bacterium OttesenSCG-928-L17]|nr:methyltransferase domain-containing protein [Christensenellaceae bacterium OttesenSCG-928-L17]
MYSFTEQFMSTEQNLRFVTENMMGPNALRLSEEMAAALSFTPKMRVLDLGAGRGLSTLLLAKKYGATVFAADLWIAPSENYARFQEMGIDDKAIPLLADATKGLPFANDYFDLLFSVDAYHYFGDTEEMLPSLIPFVKKGGYIAVAVPGIKYEFGENIPEEMKPFWVDEVARTIHSPGWWKELWNKAKGIEIVDISEMHCCDLAWKEWHTSSWPGIEEDIKMKQAENGNYYNLIQMIARVL